MLLFSRPLRGRWGFQASYVLSKAEGNVDNNSGLVLQFGPHRFGLYADLTNLFNIATITSRQTRVPSSGDVNYQAPTGVQGARQVTFGARWSF